MSSESSQKSPRLSALEEALAAGDSLALDEFWAEIEHNGTPLFEPIEGVDQHIKVTFLWRGGDDLKHVLIMSAVVGFDPEFKTNFMTRLADTDVWYRTEQIRRDLLTTYQFSPNDSLAPMTGLKTAAAFRERMTTYQPDPLNPNVYIYPKDGDDPDDWEMQVSILAAPDTKSQPHVEKRPHVPQGQLEKFTIGSKILDNERRVWVYTPPDYAPDRRPYPLLVLFDGLAYIQSVPTPTILDNLIADNAIPPMVAVMVGNVKDQRNIELACNPKFAQFVGDELIPWVREQVEVIYDPTQTVIGGSSYGALAAVFCALWYPNLFGKVLSQSGSFWWSPEEEDEPGWLIRQYLSRAKLDLQFYMDVGLLERSDFGKQGISQRSMNRHFRDILKAKGYPMMYVEYSGGHDYVWWQQTLADGLIALMGKSR